MEVANEVTNLMYQVMFCLPWTVKATVDQEWKYARRYEEGFNLPDAEYDA